MMNLDNLKGLDVASLMRDATGQPLTLRTSKIEPDPDNIRSKVDPTTIQELAASIKSQGLIQPISVRTHPKKKDHYLINAGERRWRATKLLGRDTIEAYVREEFDPYVQAAENIQREDLSPIDLARWIAKREAEGDDRATIARKLGKPRSFITEIAKLIEAPDAIVQALDAGQISDARTAYVLTNAWEKQSATVRQLLGSAAPLSRASVVSALAATPSPTKNPAPTEQTTGDRQKAEAKAATALGVEVAGRKGRLVFKPGRARRSAEVVFEDGARELVELTKIRLTEWIDWR